MRVTTNLQNNNNNNNVTLNLPRRLIHISSRFKVLNDRNAYSQIFRCRLSELASFLSFIFFFSAPDREYIENTALQNLLSGFSVTHRVIDAKANTNLDDRKPKHSAHRAQPSKRWASSRQSLTGQLDRLRRRRAKESDCPFQTWRQAGWWASVVRESRCVWRQGLEWCRRD